MWKATPIAVIWFFFFGEERYKRCFEGRSSALEVLLDLVQFNVATQVSSLPQFCDFSVQTII